MGAPVKMAACTPAIEVDWLRVHRLDHEPIVIPVKCDSSLTVNHILHVKQVRSDLQTRLGSSAGALYNLDRSEDVREMTVREIVDKTYVNTFLKREMLYLPNHLRTATLRLHPCDVALPAPAEKRRRKTGPGSNRSRSRRQAATCWCQVWIWC